MNILIALVVNQENLKDVAITENLDVLENLKVVVIENLKDVVEFIIIINKLVKPFFYNYFFIIWMNIVKKYLLLLEYLLKI